MTKKNDHKESKMLTHVRAWRRDAYKARRQLRDPKEQAREREELLRSFGLNQPKHRKPAA